MNRKILFAPFILSALLLSNCDLGSPTTGGGTEGEGVVGSLVDAAGSPKSGVWIKAYPVAGAGGLSNAAAVADSAQTSANGSYAFTGLANGTYNLAAMAAQGDTTLSVWISNVLVAGNTDVGRDTLRRSGNLTLQVQAGGDGLGGALCFLPSSPWTSVSDGGGACVLNGLPPGTFRITVSHSAFDTVLSENLSVLSGSTTNAGVVSLQNQAVLEAPEAPSLVSPASIVTVTPLSGTLNWRRSARAASYHVQLATDSIFTALQLNDSGLTDSSRAYGPLTAGTYYWRVRAKNAFGTSSWSATWKFVTVGSTPVTPPIDSSVPGAPTLVQPADGALNQSVTISFAWNVETDAVNYRLQIATDSSFSTLARDTTLGDTAAMIYGLPGSGTYFWRVRAAGAAVPGPWSQARWLTRSANSTSPPPPTPLQAPTANAVNVSLSPTFTWQSWTAAATTTYYQLQVSSDTLFTNILVNDSVPPGDALGSTSRTIGPLASLTVYYWRVLAYGPAGSSTSATRRFTTLDIALPAMPQLAAPRQGDTVAPASAGLSWNVVAGAAQYHVQVSRDSGFTTGLVYNDSGITDTTQLVPLTLTSGVRHYWRVRAKSGSTGAGLWSAIRMFVTSGPSAPAVPTAPTLLTPVNSAVVTVTPTLSWSPVSGASAYKLQVASDTLFTSIVFSDSAASAGTSRVIGPLTAGTNYYWKVRSEGTAGISAYSSPRRFKTED